MLSNQTTRLSRDGCNLNILIITWDIKTNHESLSNQNHDQALLKHQDNSKDYTSETTKLGAQTLLG
jgi:hypothetical protein